MAPNPAPAPLSSKQPAQSMPSMQPSFVLGKKARDEAQGPATHPASVQNARDPRDLRDEKDSKQAYFKEDDNDENYLDDMPTLTKDTLQFLRCESDDETDPKKSEGKDGNTANSNSNGNGNGNGNSKGNASDEGSDDEREGGDEHEDEALARFLSEHKLGHLYKKFEQFGITASNIKTLTALTLEQLGISKDDQQKLLHALH